MLQRRALSCGRAAALLTLALALLPTAIAASCDGNSPASLTITGSVTTQAACDAAAALLSADPAFLAYNVAFVSNFTCTCTPTPTTTSPDACSATLTALIMPLQLLQYYANVWAVPLGGTYGTGQYSIQIFQSNPTCESATYTCADLFPGRALYLLGACDTTVTYFDSCGGAAQSPATCTGQLYTPPSPARVRVLPPSPLAQARTLPPSPFPPSPPAPRPDRDKKDKKPKPHHGDGHHPHNRG